MDQHIDGLRFHGRQAHSARSASNDVISRNINQAVGILHHKNDGDAQCVGVEDRLYSLCTVTRRNKPGIGKLVQRVIDGTICHLYAGRHGFRALRLSADTCR